MPILIAALYQFRRVDDPHAFAAVLRNRAAESGLRGTLILAREGINGTIAGEPAPLRAFVADLQAGISPGPAFDALTLKWARTQALPFGRMKVKVKPEIVTLGVPEADPTLQVGHYIAPQDWDALIAEPDVLLIDTRNSFEFKFGTFPGAVDPGTTTFREFPAFVASQLDPKQNTRVAMFCTGGIRCEKASALLLAHGFKEVYHLQGGILAYLEKMPAEARSWQGECFVFDERVAPDPASLGLQDAAAQE
ncbi:MAG: rhodanese-like domain-containing protein [Acetobacteraceae bacterium]|nr:rhodanese-like domain-containing protein [Acetobacteraceae bacterium]